MTLATVKSTVLPFNHGGSYVFQIRLGGACNDWPAPSAPLVVRAEWPHFPFEATAAPAPPLPQRVKMELWLDNLTLGPGKSGTWFQDNVLQDCAYVFTAVPISTGIDFFVPYDQFVEVTNVFYILKGDDHARDGSGGQRTLQVNVRVQNRDETHPVTFRICKAELR